MSNDKKHNRPKYSLEFKQDATKLVLEKGYSQQQAADHLGISQSALGRWVRAERKPSANESTLKKSCLNLGDHDELIRLRQENEQLRMEREILKKAAVFFAKEAEYPQGTSKVRIYSGATEDVSRDRAVSSDAGEHQCLLCLV
ncbi:transposase [Methylomonas sp. HW2-6]|uniref:transposase n=1 Tax=Methylomonas sp. HW2-6 TaxID=3376687 RepID=UPI0040417006